MTALRFTIPGPPVPCGRARSGNGRTYTPECTRKYEEHCKVHAWAAAMKAKWRPGRGPYGIELDFYRDRDVGDGDNYAKAVVDPMHGIVVTNDKQIHDWRIRLFIDRERPRVEVRIRVLAEGEGAW